VVGGRTGAVYIGEGIFRFERATSLLRLKLKPEGSIMRRKCNTEGLTAEPIKLGGSSDKLRKKECNIFTAYR